MHYKNKKRNSGQALPITIALVTLLSVGVFTVFNSHRAVDEKMNLVNAADAVAFSGAQMAARELNFMALTNRAMIANEIAIGHMMAYQTEIDVVADALKNGTGGLIGVVIAAFVNLIGGDPTIDALNAVNKIWSGTYILAVNASNAMYQDYQEDDYRALAGLERDSLLDAVMNTVAQQYITNPPGTPRVEIEVNSPNAIAGLEAEARRGEDVGVIDEALLQIARAASGNPFCHHIVFAQPSAATGGSTPFNQAEANRFSALQEQCQTYYENENGSIPSALGSLTDPVDDAGVLVELLNRSANNASSAEWVMRRNANYRMAFAQVERRGESSAVWDDSGSGQINWETNGEDTIETRGIEWFLSFEGRAEGNAKTLSNFASTRIGGAVVAMLRTAGLCDEIDCNTLANGTYTGTQRYAVLNPLSENNEPVVTAVLRQNGNCNDNLGRDSNGELTNQWLNDELPFVDGSVCNGQTLYAYAQAKVIYQRPTCTEPNGTPCVIGFRGEGVTGERPNLFNPFWQAKLVATPVE